MFLSFTEGSPPGFTVSSVKTHPSQKKNPRAVGDLMGRAALRPALNPRGRALSSRGKTTIATIIVPDLRYNSNIKGVIVESSC